MERDLIMGKVNKSVIRAPLYKGSLHRNKLRRMAIDTIDDYVASQPAEIQPILQEVRRRFHEAVPGAGEMISYGIPTITLDGHYVVYFAGWKHHVSVYPVPHGDEELRAEMAPHLTGKGTLKFPLGKPIPYDMIEKVAARLAAERQGRK